MTFRRMGGVTALALVLMVSPIMTLPASAAPPTLSLSSPAAGASTNASPTFSGTTDCTIGACSDVIVNVYSGALAVGLPVRTLTAPRGAAWSIPSGTSFPDGTYTVTATQTRQGGNGGTTTTPARTFIIDTTGPVITFSSADASSVAEGSITRFGYSIVDSGVGTISSVIAGCGAGVSSNPTHTNSSGAVDCRFDDGPITGSVVAQATDTLGNQGPPASRSISVTNVAPSVAITSGATELFDGQSSTYAYTIADPGNDAVVVSPSCGSGDISNAVNDAVSGSFECAFPTVGPTSVSVVATDSDGDSGMPASVDVTIVQTNRAPQADEIVGDASAFVGEGKSYSVVASDPDGDVLSYAWSVVAGAAIFEGATTRSDARVAFPASGTVELAVEISDNNGHTLTRTTTVEVTLPPLPEPTVEPTIEPTVEPTVEPTMEPTIEPTVEPTIEPTVEPTDAPTVEPTAEPTVEPTVEPSAEPTVEPSAEPTTEPTGEPTGEPTDGPTVEPTAEPTTEPTTEPTPDPEPSETSPAPELPPGPHPSLPPDGSGSGGGTGPGVPPSDEQQVGSDGLVPVAIGGADMEAISPNSDGRMDAVNVVVRFSEPVEWSFDLLGPGGEVVHASDRSRVLDMTWDGTIDGTPVPDGTYMWRVTGTDMSGNALEPLLNEIVVDTLAPEIKRVRVHAKTKRRAPRGRVAVTVAESSDVQVMLVGRSNTYTLTVMHCPEGKVVHARWTGRDALGRPIPAGTYRVVAVATDATWNQAMFQGRRIRVTR